LKDAIQQLKHNISKPSTSTYDLEKASDAFTETILQEADKDANLEAYEAAWQKNMRFVNSKPTH
jgi:hypothetical protein